MPLCHTITSLIIAELGIIFFPYWVVNTAAHHLIFDSCGNAGRRLQWPASLKSGVAPASRVILGYGAPCLPRERREDTPEGSPGGLRSCFQNIAFGGLLWNLEMLLEGSWSQASRSMMEPHREPLDPKSSFCFLKGRIRMAPRVEIQRGNLMTLKPKVW